MAYAGVAIAIVATLVVVFWWQGVAATERAVVKDAATAVRGKWAASRYGERLKKEIEDDLERK